MGKDGKIISGIAKGISEVILRALRTGADDINFEILNMLPANTEEVMKKTGITKKELGERVRALRTIGFVKRHCHDGEIIPGKMNGEFIKIIKTIKEKK